MSLKTDLCASEPKYNSKMEFGVERNNSLLLCQGQEAAAGSGLENLQARPQEGAGGLYREMQDFAGFHRNGVLAASPLCHVSWWCPAPETNSRLREAGGLRKGGKGLLSAPASPKPSCSQFLFHFMLFSGCNNKEFMKEEAMTEYIPGIQGFPLQGD